MPNNDITQFAVTPNDVSESLTFNVETAVGTVSWGDIEGTLSNQTDLNTALGLKQDKADMDDYLVKDDAPGYADILTQTSASATYETKSTVTGINNRLTTAEGDITELNNDVIDLYADKQDLLVSSGANQNIKTINNTSLLGTGDITVGGLPAGGVSGDMLVKNSATSGDASWQSVQAIYTDDTEGGSAVSINADTLDLQHGLYYLQGRYTTCELPIFSTTGSQTINVSNITSDAHPTLAPLITNASDKDAINEAWSHIYRATTSSGTITFYSDDATETALTIMVKGY